jgi:NAD(P)-dependent dehydrogenase (short-subunit alcohol dehydrogenase family)
MKGRICLVTGANTGVGLETARGLAERGATVIVAARDRAKGEAAVEDLIASTGNDTVQLLDLDLASQSSIRAAAQTCW